MNEEIKDLKDKIEEHLKIAKARGQKDKTMRLTIKEIELIVVSLINNIKR